MVSIGERENAAMADAIERQMADRVAREADAARQAAGARYDTAVRDVWAGIPRELGARAALDRARPGMVAAQQRLDADLAAAKAGFEDAARIVTAQYAAGVDLDAIAAHHDDLSASLQTDAQTGPSRAFAREYADTARTLIADLRQDAAVAQGRSAAACTLAQGTPHPDPVLAAKGWQVDQGVEQRTGQAQQLDREAG